MLINENLKETIFNYCTQWLGVADQEIDCCIISMVAMSHSTRRNGFHKNELFKAKMNFSVAASASACINSHTCIFNLP